MTEQESPRTWNDVFAVLVVILALGLVYTATSEQPDEAPSHLNESVSAFYEDCKANGGTFLMETEDMPADDYRCTYENGSNEDYAAREWPKTENQTTTTGNVSLDGLPADNGTTFMISTGDEPPPGWGYPATVEFEHMNRSTVHTTTIYERERFTIDLEDGENYRNIVESPNGQPRSLGILKYTDRMDEPVHIIVG